MKTFIKELISSGSKVSSKRVMGMFISTNALLMKWYLVYKASSKITSTDVMINIGNIDSISSGLLYAGCALIGAGVIEGFTKKDQGQ